MSDVMITAIAFKGDRWKEVRFSLEMYKDLEPAHGEKAAEELSKIINETTGYLVKPETIRSLVKMVRKTR